MNQGATDASETMFQYRVLAKLDRIIELLERSAPKSYIIEQPPRLTEEQLAIIREAYARAFPPKAAS